MENRLKLKNDVILEIEENGKKPNSEMLKLQVEVQAWKMQASRQDDTLIQQSNGDCDVSQDKDTVPTSSKSKEDTEKDERRERDNSSKLKDTGDVINLEKLEDKKKVKLIGTSNLKIYIHVHQYVVQPKLEAEKETKYKLKEWQEYIDSLKPHEKKLDAIVLHLIENDITEQTPEYCPEKLHKLFIDIQRNQNSQKLSYL